MVAPLKKNIFVYLPLGKLQLEAASYFLNGRAIKALPPPHELNGIQNFFLVLKKPKMDFDNFFPPYNF